jgi:hypothetical protein
MTEKAIIKVIVKTNNKAIIKSMSAIFSYRLLNFSFVVRMERKEKRLLAINKMHATPVNSSINVTSLNLDILSEVKTIRQNPNKLDDVFRMCSDFLFAINF